MTSHEEAPRTSKLSSPFEESDSRILRGYCGPNDLATPAHFISSLRPTPRRKKCLRTNKEVPNCQETLSRTILSSTNRGHGRIKRHALKDSHPRRPKQKGLI